MKQVYKKPAAEKRFPKYFQISDEIIYQFHNWIDIGNEPKIQKTSDVVYIALAVRALNIYRSIVMLLEKDHWEDALILTRSIFELLLNIEEIQRDKTEIESKSRGFFLFYRLQEYLRSKAIDQYNIKTERKKKIEKIIAEEERVAELLFNEFLIVNNKGKKRWSTSWCGKTILELAKASAQPIKESHYHILYSYMSAFSHSAPLSVMSTIDSIDPQKELNEVQLAREKKEEEELKMVLFFSSCFILEVMLRVRDVIPDYDTKWNLQILSKIFHIWGFKPPTSPP